MLGVFELSATACERVDVHHELTPDTALEILRQLHLAMQMLSLRVNHLQLSCILSIVNRPTTIDGGTSGRAIRPAHRLPNYTKTTNDGA